MLIEGKKYALFPRICRHCEAVIWLEYGERIAKYWWCKYCSEIDNWLAKRETFKP